MEILYRGQSRRYGEVILNVRGDKAPSVWRYGGILQGTGCYSIIYGWDNPDDMKGSTIDKHVVYSDTLGQYVGRTDINEKKIFTGDIVRFGTYRTIAKVEWSETKLQFVFIIYSKVKGTEEVVPESEVELYLFDDDIEIIGNIYDNPELLKGE